MRHPQCTLTGPGHQINHLQARKLSEALHPAQGDPDQFRAVELTDLGGGWFETEIDGETRLGWNHGLDDVAALARDSVLGQVLYLPAHSALVCVRGQFDTAPTRRRILYPAWGNHRRCAPVLL